MKNKSIVLTSNLLKKLIFNFILLMVFLNPIIVKGIMIGNSKKAYLGEPAPMYLILEPQPRIIINDDIM